MKHTLRKVFATISAAAMCAIPTINAFTANAAAPANPKYTYRKDFFVKSNANLDRIIFGWGLNSNYNSTPYSVQKVPGELQRYGSGAVNYHMGGGNFYPSSSSVTGLVLTEYIYTNDTTLYSENTTLYAYDKNDNNVSNKVYATPSFMVGDLNDDKTVDGQDHSVILEAISKTGYKSSFTHTQKVYFTLGGASYNIYLYKLDINNDGKISTADASLLDYYNQHRAQNYKFPE